MRAISSYPWRTGAKVVKPKTGCMLVVGSFQRATAIAAINQKTTGIMKRAKRQLFRRIQCLSLCRTIRNSTSKWLMILDTISNERRLLRHHFINSKYITIVI